MLPRKLRRRDLTVPGYRMLVVLHDPFGTPVGRGYIDVDPQTYVNGAFYEDDTAESMKRTHQAVRVGRYVQAAPVGPAAYIRLTMPDD